MFGRLVARRFSTTVRKRGGFNPDDEMIPVHNMLWKTDNTLRFTIVYALFVSSGLSFPFLAIRHHALKK